MGRKKKARIAPAKTSAMRRRTLRKLQSGEFEPTFTRGLSPCLPWPAQRHRADESLAVENLRRAYYDWKMNRRAAR